MHFQTTALLICGVILIQSAPAQSPSTPGAGKNALVVQARPGMLRVDLSWPSQGEKVRYEVQRAASPLGPWTSLPNPTPEFHRFTDFIGTPKQRFFYQVRSTPGSGAGDKMAGEWSRPVDATTLPYDRNRLMAEVQAASVRFFFEQADPDSGLSPEGAPGWQNVSAIGSTGMGMVNLLVGVERGIVPRNEGIALALKMLRFLDTKAEKQRGAFGHWVNKDTGAILKFGSPGTAVDLVETAFLMQGIILLREYFSGNTQEEKELREIANRLSAGVEWDKFMVEEKNGPVMMWHWHPENGFSDLAIRGFNEAMMPYVLGIGSDTHPIDPKSFYTGWMDAKRGLGQDREDFGVQHSMGRGIGWPMFFAHYSFIGFDPKAISYKGKPYFEHFADACLIQERYAVSRTGEFKGYDTLWGQTASLSPRGYRANEPGDKDDGTIATTAALSSMPYLPVEAFKCMESMYLNYGKQIWGPYGFYNAFNPTQNWVGRNYIGIELGPVGPMLENYTSGLLWKLFMKSPEAKRALQRIQESESAQ